MSDTERLEAAAGWFESRATERERCNRHGGGDGDLCGLCDAMRRSNAEDRAVAALLRILNEHLADSTACRYCSRAALAVADAVLGVPASPKEQTDS